MNTNKAVTLKTTEDVKALEREMRFYNRFAKPDYKWHTNQLVKANLADVFNIKDPGWKLPDAFLPHERKHIPKDLLVDRDKDYKFDPLLIRRIMGALAIGKPIMLAGPQGCGKTTTFEQFYAHLGLPCAIVQCTSSMDSDYLFGFSSLVSKDGATASKFLYGQLTGTRVGHVNLLLDEVTHLNSHVSPDLNRFLEMKSDIRLSGEGFDVDSESQIVKATPFQDVWMTSNTGGREEADAGFVGNSALSTATLDRPVMIDVDYLCPEMEKEVFLKKVAGGHDWIDSTIKFANLIRDAYKSTELPKSMSTRSGLDFMNYLYHVSDISTAFCDTILAKYNESDRQLVVDLFSTAFDLKGDSLKIPTNLIQYQED